MPAAISSAFLQITVAWNYPARGSTVRNLLLCIIIGSGFFLLASCSGRPSDKVIKSDVIKLMKMEGCKDIEFESFEIAEVKQNSSCNQPPCWRVKIRMAGTFRQNPHLYFDHKYQFKTVRDYEFYRSGYDWQPYVVSLTPIYQDAGSHEIE